MEIAERRFEVEASRDRIWRLIGKVIFACQPGMEQVEILDENNFRALLRVRIPFMTVAMKLRGEMVDVSAPESFSVRLQTESMGGLLRVDQKVSIAMTSLGTKQTAMTCKATAEKMGLLFRILFLGEACR